MSSDAAVVDLAAAQRVFDSLPSALQLPSLSPGYVTADARRDPRLRPLFFVWQRDSVLLTQAFHESEVPGYDTSDWQSPYGYGGPILAGCQESLPDEAWKALDGVARERGVIAEFIRFHPVLANDRWYPGKVRLDRQVVLIELTANLLDSYSGRARTAIRKAQKEGLESSWLVPAVAKVIFPDFYREAMRQIGATDFYLFNSEYFDALLDLPQARVLSITRSDAPLAMGIFLFGPRTVEYHLSATASAGRSLGATNLLLHRAAERALESGATGLFLGGGTDARPDNPLLLFKSSFAPARLSFHIGSRIHQPKRYDELRVAFPELAASGRVLFYRR